MRIGAAYRVALGVLCAAAVRQAAALALDEGFVTPPRSARPHTWYHMMNGNVTKEGITCDFEALARAGIGGVQMFDAGCAIPPGPLKFNTPDWFDLFAHAQKEAKRLGLEICIPNCSGWSSSGGPWNPPANGMKVVTLTETGVKGGATFSGRLPRTEKDNGFYEDIAVLAYPTPAKGGEIPGLDRKIFRSAGQKNSPLSRSGGFPWSLGFKAAPKADQIVAPADVIDLTGRMSADGSLVWTAPAGRDWTILRIGYACNGRCNHPASEKGRGLEVDKLSAAAMDFHFEQYVSRLCRTLGISDRTDNTLGFNNILVDSYEVDSQNWTQGFDRTFEQRAGYPIRPYLPVFAGHVVGSVETTERFLEDFRRVVADLFAENYAGRLAELCHRHGLKLSLEPYGNCPSDDLQYGEAADVPMAEFWSQAFMGDHRCSDTGNSRHAAHVAHVWGRRYAATESFTAHPGPGGRWYTTPFSIKSQGDRVFAEGVNRIIYHRFTHQPWPGNRYVPGLTMGRWGMHLDRTQTWWPLANDWFAYQARCQWMLQEGLFAADVLYWSGEAVPNNNVVNTHLPAGYNWDVCATAAFLRLRVEDGKVVVPGGVRYSLLVLPETDTMSERSLRKVAELLRAGAKICAVRRPTRAPGLKGLDSAAVRKLVAETWSLGVLEGDAGAALAKLGLRPDVEIGTDAASWIHRASAETDWYFVATDNPTPVAFEASFRQKGRVPEVWEPLTGERRDAPAWREENGRTVVALRFPPSGSAFVVFRRASGTVPHVASVRTTSRRPAVVTQRHVLEIRAAAYGAIKPGETRPAQPFVDLTSKLQGRVRDGTLLVPVNNDLAGRDPVAKVRKALSVTFVLDGVERTEIYDENSVCMIPRLADVRQPPPEWEWRDGGILAWRPQSFELSRTDGTTQALSAAPSAPIEVKGAWQVAFPAGWDAPAFVTFPELLPWNEHQDDGVKYFSGTATYTRSVALPALKKGVRVMLDLGEVKNFAEVKVNGRAFPVLWKPPFRLDVTDALKLGDTAFELEVKVTNLWANRLIGDDRLYAPDCQWKERSHRGKKEIPIRCIPDWVKEGKRSPTGRHTFTTWQHWSKEDDLLPSGLIGPVKLRFGERAVPASAESFETHRQGGPQ